MKTKNTLTLLEDYLRVSTTMEKFQDDSNPHGVIKAIFEKISDELDVWLHREADIGEQQNDE